MEKRMKKWVSVVLALVMFLCLFPVTEAEAATKNMTMYVGESLEIYMGQPLKTVSSSNSQAVSVKREAPDHIYATITGVKPGTSTVVCKTGKKTNRMKVTVKKLDMPVKALFKTTSDNVVFSVQNKSSKFYEIVEFEYTLVDGAGTVVKEGSVQLVDVFPKSTKYTDVYVGNKLIDSIDLSASSGNVTRLFNQSKNTYHVVSSKVKATTKYMKEANDTVSFDLYLNNTTNKYVYLEYELHVYDKNNHLLGVETPMIKDHYLKAKEKRYASSGFSVSKKTYPKYHHFKVVVHSYYVE